MKVSELESKLKNLQKEKNDTKIKELKERLEYECTKSPITDLIWEFSDCIYNYPKDGTLSRQMTLHHLQNIFNVIVKLYASEHNFTDTELNELWSYLNEDTPFVTKCCNRLEELKNA